MYLLIANHNPSIIAERGEAEMGEKATRRLASSNLFPPLSDSMTERKIVDENPFIVSWRMIYSGENDDNNFASIR